MTLYTLTYLAIEGAHIVGMLNSYLIVGACKQHKEGFTIGALGKGMGTGLCKGAIWRNMPGLA